MKFIEIPIDTLNSAPLLNKEDVGLDVYCSPNIILRKLFWLRLKLLVTIINWTRPKKELALDFCGGSGVMIPTLSNEFERVYLIDKCVEDAQYLVSLYNFSNINIQKEDITNFDYEKEKFDVIIAADVLEHFQTLEEPISKISSWLKFDGILYTSLPTENYFYGLLRFIFRKKKPWDHYHTAAYVEKKLKQNGFKKIIGIYHPLMIPLLPLFRISAWKKIEGLS